ncbi:52 kDa repressor of the inhibitor of the protein kinase [Holothuria leucospilota]|uniref:52 kDa repressor of the inhibitor of the protein kinase n=1 Tax=Holothuria leucospilota TaxID=206669 RepID=A0A9Q1BFG0_HOLLE|nr:52 kDa repressor of the inhibitor of the protein kinase [Holothuria leucospilota]
MPSRSGGISRCRNTTPAPDPETYYRQNVAIPFFDNIQSDQEQQFSGLSSVVEKIQFLVPSLLCSLSITPDVSELAQFYEQDLPSSELLQSEVRMWRTSNMGIDHVDRAKTVRSLKLCDRQLYPNVHEHRSYHASNKLRV